MANGDSTRNEKAHYNMTVSEHLDFHMTYFSAIAQKLDNELMKGPVIASQLWANGAEFERLEGLWNLIKSESIDTPNSDFRSRLNVSGVELNEFLRAEILSLGKLKRFSNLLDFSEHLDADDSLIEAICNGLSAMYVLEYELDDPTSSWQDSKSYTLSDALKFADSIETNNSDDLVPIDDTLREILILGGQIAGLDTKWAIDDSNFEYLTPEQIDQLNQDKALQIFEQCSAVALDPYRSESDPLPYTGEDYAKAMRWLVQKYRDISETIFDPSDDAFAVKVGLDKMTDKFNIEIVHTIMDCINRSRKDRFGNEISFTAKELINLENDLSKLDQTEKDLYKQSWLRSNGKPLDPEFPESALEKMAQFEEERNEKEKDEDSNEEENQEF